ncbi:hypothetical protein LSM04_007976 [Trypanosoma melophagium]|uniref:uncharacterized protein n=1 Tax=Trypanosoma melophagium TaxID=715481 RepID=UPI00351A9E16|nr:hypothetical protein LSM04_007976 [Trypanosoma melophagium]
MLRRTFPSAATYTLPLCASATGKVEAKKAAKATQVSKVNGATGPDGDSMMDKLMVGGCLSAVTAWFVFGPPIKSHH